jgi:uncharacterized repeat protein (TIGR01451 family)
MRPVVTLALSFLLSTFLFPAVLAAQLANASLDVQQSSPDPSTAGTTISFVLNANNEGPGSAASPAIATAVPANTTFAGLTAPAGWSCTTPPPGGTGAINCSAAWFGPGTDALLLDVVTAPNTPRGTTVTLSASMTTQTTDPDADDNSDSESTTVAWSTILGLSKSGPAGEIAGTAFAYSIGVTNGGPSYAGDLTFTDTIAAPLRFVSLTAPGWSCTTPAPGGGAISCTRAELDISTSTITLQVDTASSETAASASNTVDLNSPTDPGLNRTATATTALSVSANLSIVKSASPSAPNAGQTIVYMIDVTNGGPSDALNVTVTDPLPAAVQYQSISAPGWSCTTPDAGASGTVSCTRASLAPSVSTIAITVLLPASTPAGTNIDNTATVSSPTFDPSTPNTSTVTASSSTSADLTVGISDAPDPVTAGTALTYTITATNAGPSIATAATLTLTPPASLTFNSLSAPAGWSCTTPAPGASGTITCNLASFAPGSAAFTLVMRVADTTPGGTTITTNASLTTSSPDPAAGNNNSSASTTSSAPSTITATKSVAGTFSAGGPIVYTIVLRNNGSAQQGDNPGHELVDVLPAQVTLVGATATSGTAVASIGSNSVAFNGAIPAGGTVTITINATISPAAPAGVPIANQATASYDADGNGTNEASVQSNDATTGGPTVFRPDILAIPTLPAAALLAMMIAMVAIAVLKLR